MAQTVNADGVPRPRYLANEARIALDLLADEKERGRRAILSQGVEDGRRPLLVRSVIEGERVADSRGNPVLDSK